MKALFISNDPKLFEAQSAVRLRMQAYADAIGELHIVSYAKERHAKEVHEHNLHLYPIHTSIFTRIHALSKKGKEIILSKGIEVVSAQDPFEHGLAALWAAKGTNARLHIQVHTDFLSPYFSKGSLKNRIRVHIASRVLPKAHGIRAVSKRVHDNLIARFGTRIGEASVIPVAVASEVPARVPLPVPTSSFTLVTISRLEKEKRIADILEALALLPPHYHMASLVVIGEGREKRHLMHLAKKRGLEGRVHFVGWRDDAWALMQSAQAYIQASAYEGYGVTLIEAALARVPIITTDVGIVGDVLQDDKNALVVSVDSPKELAAAIEELIEDDVGVRRVLANRAEIDVKEHLAHFADIPSRIAADLRRLFPSYQYHQPI